MSATDLARWLAPLSTVSKEELWLGTEIGKAVGASFGIKSAKTEERTFHHGYEVVVLSLIAALKQSGNEMTAIVDVPRGAIADVSMPSDAFSFGGTLRFDIVDEAPTQVRVVGRSEVKGQLFDWGKGKRALSAVFSGTDEYLHRLAPPR